MPPAISVVMPVHNEESHVAAAIDSVLGQTLGDFELIVIDDGSTDATPAILDSYRDPRIVRVTHPSCLGLGRSLNDGLRRASGKYVARIDGNDEALPERFSRQVEVLEADPSVGIVGSGFIAHDASRPDPVHQRYPAGDTGIRWRMLFHCPFGHVTVMFRRELAPAGGLRYREDLAMGEDFDLWIRVMGVTRGANIDDPLMKVRYTPKGMSTVLARESQDVASDLCGMQLSRLVPERPWSREEIVALRQWYFGIPPLTCRAEFDLCVRYLDLLRRFGESPMVDRADFRRLAREIMGRVTDAFSLRRQLGAALRSGLLRAQVATDPGYMAGRLVGFRKGLRGNGRG